MGAPAGCCGRVCGDAGRSEAWRSWGRPGGEDSVRVLPLGEDCCPPRTSSRSAELSVLWRAASVAAAATDRRRRERM